MIEDTVSSPELELPPLTDWKNPPTVAALQEDLQAAKRAHNDQTTKVTNWLNNLNVEGDAKVKTPKGRSKHVPRLIRKQAEWRYASLSEPFLNTYDLFDAKPVTWEDKESAKQNKLLLNHQINQKIDKTAFIDEYVRTAVDEGTVIVRVGWDFEEATETVTKPTFKFVPDDSMIPVFEEMIQLQEENPTAFMQDVPEELHQAMELTQAQGVPVRPVISGSEEVEETRTVKNHPTLDVCNHDNTVIDPTCLGKLSNAKFVIYSYETTKAELAKDPRYKNLDHIQVNDSSALADPDHEVEDNSDFTFVDDARKKVILREYWGYWAIHGEDGELVPFVASWIGRTMVRLEESPFPDKQLPFVKVQYLPARRKIYGEPDGHLLEENQKIAGAVTRGMIDTMARSANGQMAIRKDALDVTNLRKFQNGGDYEFNANVDPRQAFYMHQYPEIPASAQYMLGLQNAEAEGLTGVKAFSQGLSGEALGDLAAGVNGVLDAASKREAGILRRLANGLVEIGYKFISMNAEFLEDDEVIRVTNEEFVPIRRDDLGGRIDLSLSISTAEEDDARAKELAFMLQTNGPNGDPGEVRLIRAEIARLRKMPDLAKRIEEYQPQPDPLDQRKKELEIELLLAQIRETDAQALERQSDAALNQAKAGNTQSDTDLKNLDFVEQESGVKQERELEQHGAQANANMRLKEFEHTLKQEDTALTNYLQQNENSSEK